MPSTKNLPLPFPVLTGSEPAVLYCCCCMTVLPKSVSKYLREIRKYFVKIQNPLKNPAGRSIEERGFKIWLFLAILVVVVLLAILVVVALLAGGAW